MVTWFIIGIFVGILIGCAGVVCISWYYMTKNPDNSLETVEKTCQWIKDKDEGE